MNDNPLYWDSSYEIVHSLMARYPQIDIEQIGIKELEDLIVSLPNFVDDPMLVNDSILHGILREWYEESNS